MTERPDIDIEAERRDFEQDASDRLPLERYGDEEEYFNAWTQSAFESWLARARLAAEREHTLLDQIAIYNRMWNELRGILRVEMPLPQGTTVAEFDYQPPLIERAKHIQAELARLRTLEEAAIHWNTHRCVHGVGRLERAIAEAASEAEKARNACPTSP